MRCKLDGHTNDNERLRRFPAQPLWNRLRAALLDSFCWTPPKSLLCFEPPRTGRVQVEIPTPTGARQSAFANAIAAYSAKLRGVAVPSAAWVAGQSEDQSTIGQAGPDNSRVDRATLPHLTDTRFVQNQLAVTVEKAKNCIPSEAGEASRFQRLRSRISLCCIITVCRLPCADAGVCFHQSRNRLARYSRRAFKVARSTDEEKPPVPVP